MILDISPPEVGEYRLSRYALESGIVFVSLFGLIGIASTLAALLNIDGSFRYPLITAVVLGVFWSGPTSYGCWLILAYYRHRLILGPQFVRVVNPFYLRSS